MLIHCAELIHRSDFPAAREAVSALIAASSACGDATDRLSHHFACSLSLRLHGRSLSSLQDPPHEDADPVLSFNQLTPFLRFCHLTANQAILEAVDDCHRRPIHILDFDTGHGLQWPPLLQAIADLPDAPPVRITGTGADLRLLLQTGRCLRSFADSLGLRFRFHPLRLSPTAPLPFQTDRPDELLAVNCTMFLHKLVSDEGTAAVSQFLHAVKAMNPVVVTVGEREASHGSPSFLHRFREALSYYAAVFESLEATLPPTSGGRMAVERMCAGREIDDIVAGEGEGRKERHERYERWEGMMKSAGFVMQPLSLFALSQARLLLRLHYPSEGYRVETMKGSAGPIFLGWKTKPLYSVSSWR
ncbi:Scarecrow-like protein 18 [Platanthera zijinensis]|uniref:Scarecrow-like protein 18 n=1 Tax=Platanthera zijinensis TaxID=2320716 RepID=A0AAP0C1M9_9ASPA